MAVLRHFHQLTGHGAGCTVFTSRNLLRAAKMVQQGKQAEKPDKAPLIPQTHTVES